MSRWMGSVAVAFVVVTLTGVALLGTPAAEAHSTAGVSQGASLDAQVFGVTTSVSLDSHSQSTDTPAVVDDCAADPPADYTDPDADTSEVIGWVEGIWYNEPLEMDFESGLTAAELERLSARTAARFEAMRCLPMLDGLPPVDIVSRDEFSNNTGALFGNTSAEERLVSNAVYETMLTIDSETNAVDVQQSDVSERTGGYYDFFKGEIVVISEDPNSLSISEGVLAHELGHAVQDQHFDLSEYERPTTDHNAGTLGLFEGDVHLIQQEYLQACTEDEWSEPCFHQPRIPDTDVPNWGLYFEQIQPYSDGPGFIDGIRAEEGWEGVNDAFENSPTSALHTVYPDTYENITPRTLDVPDRSTAEWDRIVIEDYPLADGPITHESLGVAAITGMFAAPAFETGDRETILTQDEMLNYGPVGQIDRFDPHDYDHPETSGWRGDELYTYRNSDNETATVWELAWTSSAAAEPFVEGYEQLIDIRGGEPAADFTNVFTFDNTSEYDLAVALEQSEDRVTIVTAPTIENLTAIDDTLTFGNVTDGNQTTGGNQTSGGNETETNTSDENATTDGDVDDDGAGFGILVGIGATAIVTFALVVTRRWSR